MENSLPCVLARCNTEKTSLPNVVLHSQATALALKPTVLALAFTPQWYAVAVLALSATCLSTLYVCLETHHITLNNYSVKNRLLLITTVDKQSPQSIIPSPACVFSGAQVTLLSEFLRIAIKGGVCIFYDNQEFLKNAISGNLKLFHTPHNLNMALSCITRQITNDHFG